MFKKPWENGRRGQVFQVILDLMLWEYNKDVGARLKFYIF